MTSAQNRLKITEIFYSLQGESSSIGKPTIFIRLTGCPLRCVYCDTAYAFTGGDWMTFEEILQEIEQYQCANVTVTGGEPLAQRPCFPFISKLIDSGYTVSIETSGAIDISEVDPKATVVMDIKTPGSGEESKNLWSNIDRLKSDDEVKFVICGHADYEWSKQMIRDHKIPQRCEVLLSPSYGQCEATVLADWILTDQLPVRMQIQLHKALWGNEAGR